MKRLALPLLLVAAIAVGCKSTSSVAGTYKGAPGSLALAEEGTFTLSREGSSDDMKGTWGVADGDKLTLIPKTIGGRSVTDFIESQAKAMKADATMLAKMKQEMTHLSGTISGDGRTITMSAGGGTVAFTKSTGS